MLSLNVLFVQALLGLATCPTVNDHSYVISDTLLKHQTFFSEDTIPDVPLGGDSGWSKNVAKSPSSLQRSNLEIRLAH